MPSRVHVLSTSGQDAAIWRKALDSLPTGRKDVFFLPEYAAVYERNGYEAKAFLLEKDGACVLYPFLVRPVEIGGASARIHGTQARDVVTPYGFGGPVTTHDSPELYKEFSQTMKAWCEEERLASEFMCPHPFTGSAALVASDCSYEWEAGKTTVFVDLSGEADSVWSQLNRGHRSSINYARKHGVVVEKVVPDAALYDAFNSLYTATMDRHGAAERWYHPTEYFRRCYENLTAAHCSFFVAWVGKDLAAWFIILHGYSNAYYHFAGSDISLSHFKASQLLMYEVSLWCQRQGFHRFFLGGGVSAKVDDSLLRYKLGFSKNTVSHMTAWRVLSAPVYAMLAEQQEAYELASCGQISSREYFPIYRRQT